jgi:carbonic anhydrase
MKGSGSAFPAFFVFDAKEFPETADEWVFASTPILVMNSILQKSILSILISASFASLAFGGGAKWEHKPSPDEALNKLKEGNLRFVRGESTFPNLSTERLLQAASESQSDHAYATIVGCSDSRVPVELLFDAGVMDLFVVRIAGNVCDTDEIGSIEYGLAHVFTPLLVVLGHTQCGAVTAVTQELQGHGHELEENIPPLVDNIIPAVRSVMESHPELHGDALIPAAIEANVAQSISDLMARSPASRALIEAGKVKVVGAIYDVKTGTVKWLP